MVKSGEKWQKVGKSSEKCGKVANSGKNWGKIGGKVANSGFVVCWSLTSLCHSNGHIETMPAREINPFTALTRIRHNDRRAITASGHDYALDSGEKWQKVGKSSEKWEKVAKSGEKLE